MGYNSLRDKIQQTLTGRTSGTQVTPDSHQAMAEDVLNYIQEVENISLSGLEGIAYTDTTPVQPDEANCAYISAVPSNTTYTYKNFADENGDAVSITATTDPLFVILFWNKKYWSYLATTSAPHLHVSAELTDSNDEVPSSKAVNDALQGKQNTLTAGKGISINGNTISCTVSGGSGGGSVTVDSTISSTSTNPVQNKVIYSALAGKQDKLTAGTGISINGDTISCTVSGGGKFATGENVKEVSIFDSFSDLNSKTAAQKENMLPNGVIAETLPHCEDTQGDTDLSITDEDGNMLVLFSKGHIKTKNFDSSKINPITPTSSDLFLNVKDYGAVGNGTTDDTEALENAMADAFAKSKSLYFPSGTYKIRRSLTLRSNMEIFGHKSAVIKKKAASTTTLTQAASAGATTIYVASVDGFEVGDQFCISSEARTYPAARHCSLGIVTKINTTNNSITFVSCYDSIKHGTIKNHAVGCYVTNSFAIFRSWGMFYDANNVEIHDLTLDGNRQNGEFGDWMNGCVHIDATTGAVDGITYKYPASNLTLRDLVIKNSPFDGVSDQGDGGLTIENCRIDNPYMHGVHFGTNYSGAKCVANEITGTANGAAFFWCQNAQNIEISTNIIKNCYKGCSDYEYGTPAQNSIITNNIFINITNYVFDFSNTGSTFKDKLIICNNMIEDVNYIIANLANKTKVSFCENIITNFVTVPTYLFATGGANNLYFIGNIAIGANEIFSNSSITKLVEVGNSWN